ncbi:hypothetical protein GW17_00035858, partial [Ensete ventricosum]
LYVCVGIFVHLVFHQVSLFLSRPNTHKIGQRPAASVQNWWDEIKRLIQMAGRGLLLPLRCILTRLCCCAGSPSILHFSTLKLRVLCRTICLTFFSFILNIDMILLARSLPSDKLRIIYIIVNCVIYVIEVGLSAFDTDVSLDVLNHPILDLIYYTVNYYKGYLSFETTAANTMVLKILIFTVCMIQLTEILPSALVLYILRKLPPRRVSGQYYPI